MAKYFDDPRPRIRDLVQLAENAQGDTWIDLLITARDIVKSVQKMATLARRTDKGAPEIVADRRMINALPRVLELASAVKRRDKNGTVKSGMAALAVFGEEES